MAVFFGFLFLIIVIQAAIITYRYPGRVSTIVKEVTNVTHGEYGRTLGWKNDLYNVDYKLPLYNASVYVFEFNASYLNGDGPVFYFSQRRYINFTADVSNDVFSYSFAISEKGVALFYLHTPASYPTGFYRSAYTVTSSPLNLRLIFNRTSRTIKAMDVKARTLLTYTSPTALLNNLQYFCLTSWVWPVVFSNVTVTLYS